MFLPFFYALRSQGIHATPLEWITLMRALHLGLHNDSLDDFYYLSRSVLVKDEAHYDTFDLVFTHSFGPGAKGELPLKIPDTNEDILRWLESARAPLRLSPEELERMKRLTPEELLKELLDRLEKQDGPHHGGHHWIGTGGTSPFGAKGSHPSGISFADETGGRSAVMLAGERRHRNLRSDLVLDVRQMGVALKRLRELRLTGAEETLDMDATIDRTCKNAGEIDLVFGRERENQVRLLLAMDTGGSMEPFRQLCERLFSAASALGHWKEFKAYFFRNCIYANLYSNLETGEHARVDDLIKDPHGRRLVIVGDAAMAPYELMIPNGVLDRWRTSDIKGIDRLRMLASAFPKRAWLNPLPEYEWESYSTTRAIQELFPMYPLTLEGLTRAVRDLT